MLPDTEMLDMTKRRAFTEGYLETATTIAAGGVALSVEVMSDLDAICESAVKFGATLNESGTELPVTISEEEVRTLGRVTALISQNQE